MPVPASITELSSSPGSNFPAGSESPALVDDYLRFHASCIAILRDLIPNPGPISVTNLVISGSVQEGVATLTGTTPSITANPTIRTWSLSANSTPTDGLTSGQSVTLHVTGNGFTVTWPTVTWVNGISPVLGTGAVVSVVTLWKVGGALYGSFAGSLG
jgi:hypothetical protein